MTDPFETSYEPAMVLGDGLPGGQIIEGDGTAGLSGGTERLLFLAELARCRMRTFYVNWATGRETTLAATYQQTATGSTTQHELTWPMIGGSLSPTFRARVRRSGITGATASAPCLVRVVYWLTAGLAASATLRLTDSIAGTLADITCPGSSGWRIAEGVVSLPTTGTDQEVSLTVTVAVNMGTAGTSNFYLASLLIVSAEPIVDTLATWDWSSTTQPAALGYSRTGTWYLVDDAAQTHLTPYADGVWGVEVDSAGNRYTVMVPGYTNILTAPRAYVAGTGNWTGGVTHTATAGTQSGPDTLAASADRAQVTSGGYGARYDAGANGVYAYSAWGRATTGTATWVVAIEHTTPASSPVSITTATTTWGRVTLLGTGRYAQPCDARAVYPGTTAGTRDVVLDAQQLVATVTYAPPYSGGTVGPCIATAAGGSIVQGGYFDVTIADGSVLALEDASTPAADQYLLYLSATSHLIFQASTNKFVLTISGSAVATSTVSSHGVGSDLGPIRVWSRADGCGITTTYASASGTVAATIAVPSTVYLLTDNLGANGFPCKIYGRGTSRATAPV